MFVRRVLINKNVENDFECFGFWMHVWNSGFLNIPGVNPASDKEVSAILFTITRGIADTSVEEEIKKKSNFSDDNIFHNTAEYLNLIKRTYMTYVAMRISAL